MTLQNIKEEYFNDKTNSGFYEDVIDAVAQRYAEEVAKEFVEWAYENGWKTYYLTTETWAKKGAEEEHTTSSLFELFKKPK